VGARDEDESDRDGDAGDRELLKISLHCHPEEPKATRDLGFFSILINYRSLALLGMTNL